jgi:hypothetical protein
LLDLVRLQLGILIFNDRWPVYRGSYLSPLGRN